MRTEHSANGSPGRAFRRNTDGVAAIEFAMVVPVLLFLYLSTVDLSLGVTINRKMQHATTVMSDLVSRTNNLKKSDLEAIFDMGDAAAAPRATKLDSAKISAIYVDSDGKAKVSWSRSRNTAADTVGSAISLPSNLSGLKSVNVIRSTAAYTYRPMGGFGVAGTFNMQKEVYSVPRTGAGVTCSDC